MMQKEESYITDGLLLWLDGLNRGGVSGEWHNLVGNEIATLSGNYSELTNCVDFPASSTPYGLGTFDSRSSFRVEKNSGTVEFCVELTALEGTGRPVISVENEYIGASIASGASNGNAILRYYTHNGNANSGYSFATVNNQTKLIASANKDRAICNGESGTNMTITSWTQSSGYALIGSRGTGNPFKGKIYSIRIYNRLLSAEEMLRNQRIDNIRFNLGLTI